MQCVFKFFKFNLYILFYFVVDKKKEKKKKNELNTQSWK